MIIGVDLDSVIASLEEPITNFHNDKYGTKIDPLNIVSYDLSVTWQCSKEEVLERLFDFYKSSYMDKIKPVEGSEEGISQLRRDNTLIIITSRPLWIKEITESWVSKYFPNTFDAIVHTNQVSKESEKKRFKSEVCLENGVDLFIEDHLKYAMDCASNNIPVLLFDRSWNSADDLHPNIKRVYNWKSIVKEVLALQ